MRKQWIALALVLALALSLCAIPALAQTDQEGKTPNTAGEEALPEEEAAEEADAPPEVPDALPPAAGDGGTPIVVRPDGTPETTAGDSTMDDELVFTGEDDFRYLALERKETLGVAIGQ